MPKIVDSSKKKHSENEDDERENAGRCELTICAEDKVSSTKGLYILGLCGTRSTTDFRIAASFSDFSCAVYSIGESMTKTITLPHGDSPIVGIKFSPLSKHILYTATRNGTIVIRDLRAKGKIVSVVRDSVPAGKPRPLASFDVSVDERLAVAGSEHTNGDSFILFWDLRYSTSRAEAENTLLGSYWESHIEDVTSLAFHPDRVTVLASGSTDGLINVFDLTKKSETSALQYSLNTESSVDRLNWLDNGNIWCTTHTHQLQLWDCEDAEPYGKFDRNAIGSHMPSDSDTCYVVRMHNANASGQPFLIAGSTGANEKLSGLGFADGNLDVCYDFVGNKQLVRDSWYNEKSNCLITGGEMGIINMWKPSDSTRHLAAVTKSLDKTAGKIRDKLPRAKPY